MMKSILSTAAALLIAGAALPITASELEQSINYGDPTAVFKHIGIASSNQNSLQVNTMYGAGKNVFQLDLTRQYSDAKSGDGSQGWGYRGRYFYINDGVGFNVDLIGNHSNSSDSTTGLVGAMYKFQVTDNIMLFPMLNAGVSANKLRATNESYNTGVIQPALYALYAFDQGHWLYANPRYSINTHKPRSHSSADKYDRGTLEVEIGAGYLVNEWSAIEMKIDYTAANNTVESGISSKANTVVWLKYGLYF